MEQVKEDIYTIIGHIWIVGSIAIAEYAIPSMIMFIFGCAVLGLVLGSKIKRIEIRKTE